MSKKPPTDEEFTESTTGHHRISPTGERVPLQAEAWYMTPVKLPLSMLLGVLGVGVGASGGMMTFGKSEDYVKATEVTELKKQVSDLTSRSDQVQRDMTDLHRDIDDVTKILNQIVTTKIILKEQPP